MTERVLVLAAHPDDESFGCGGTIAKHVAAGDEVSIVAFADGVGSRGFSRALIAERHGAFRRACKILGTENVWVHQYADNKMDTLALLQVVKHIEIHLSRFSPSIVYTHHDGDLNVDHRVMNDATRVACRPQPGCTVKQLLYFEIPCSTTWGNSFKPTHHIAITGAPYLTKIEAIKCYGTELRDAPHPRSLASIEKLAAYRGFSIGVDVAEAFEVERSVA